MNPWLLLLLWVATQAVQLTALISAVLREYLQEQGHLGPLVVGAFATFVPLHTLVLFLMVFVIGGSSNVAQMAGPSGIGLWRMWASAWPLFLLGNPLCFVVFVVALCLPPYPRTNWPALISRLGGACVAGFAWYVALQFFPDA